MNVLLIGSGGSEHAIAWKLAQSKNLGKLYIAPGNAGTAHCGKNIPIGADETNKLVDFAGQNDIGLVVVGPEAPLAAGLVDVLEAAGIKAFGPGAGAARLEADKVFVKHLMRSSAIAGAEGRIFERFNDAKAYIATRDEPVVIKPAGLAKGKRAFVCDDPADGILAAEKIMRDKIFGSAGDKIIVEDKLLGEEASILALVDGRNIYIMESSQNHRHIGDGGTGPDTPGMGAYSPAPVVTEALTGQIAREIIVPVVDGMNRGGTPYKGVLHVAFIITAGGPRVLGFNVCFGDPETQPILIRLKSDLLKVLLAVCDGTLNEITLDWDQRPAVCVVMASAGYPGRYEKGKKIIGLDEAGSIEDVVVFHDGTAAGDADTITNGGRVLGVTALGRTIEDAKKRAYQAVDKIKFDGAYYRRDIADKAIKRKR